VYWVDVLVIEKEQYSRHYAFNYYIWMLNKDFTVKVRKPVFRMAAIVAGLIALNA
jgi:hypothetical protein